MQKGKLVIIQAVDPKSVVVANVQRIHVDAALALDVTVKSVLTELPTTETETETETTKTETTKTATVKKAKPKAKPKPKAKKEKKVRKVKFTEKRKAISDLVAEIRAEREQAKQNRISSAKAKSINDAPNLEAIAPDAQIVGHVQRVEQF